MNLRYSKKIAGFRGYQSSESEATASPEYAHEAYNIAFNQNKLQIPRNGFGVYFDLLGTDCRSNFEWQHELGDILVFYTVIAGVGSLGAIIGRNTGVPEIVQIGTGYTADHMRFAALGNVLAVCQVAADGKSAAGEALTVIWNGTTFTVSVAFSAPLSFTFTTSFNITGFTTIGKHWIGYVPEYLDSHLGKACPDNTGAGFLPTSENFVPILGELTTPGPNGGGTITGSFGSLTWPANVKAIHLIVTPSINDSDFYFVPGGRIAVTPGATQTITFSINVSDSELFKADSANGYLGLIVRGPGAFDYAFRPHNCFVLDRRMGWIANSPALTGAVSAVFMSDQDDIQVIQEAFSFVKLPNGADILCGYAVDNGFRLAGTKGVANVTVTFQDPATWPVRFLDESVNVLSVNAMIPDKSAATGESETTASKFWLITSKGVIHCSGYSIPPRPLSERFSNWWKRINWQAPNKVQFVDLPEKFTLYIMVPLDNSIYPTHILTVSYWLGKSESQINFHVTQISGYQMGTIGVVLNKNPYMIPNGNYRRELWVMPRNTAFFMRMKEDGDRDALHDVSMNTYTDDVNGFSDPQKILSYYVVGSMPKSTDSLSHVGPFTISLQGKGTLVPQMITYPENMVLDYGPIDIPSFSLSRAYSVRKTRTIRTQAINLKLQMKNAGDWCLVGSVDMEHDPATIVPADKK